MMLKLPVVEVTMPISPTTWSGLQRHQGASPSTSAPPPGRTPPGGKPFSCLAGETAARDAEAAAAAPAVVVAAEPAAACEAVAAAAAVEPVFASDAGRVAAAPANLPALPRPASMRKLACSEFPSLASMQKAGRPVGPRMPRSVAGAKMATAEIIIIIRTQDIRSISRCSVNLESESRKQSVRKHKVIKKPYPTARTSHKTRSLRNLRASHKTTVQQTFANTCVRGPTKQHDSCPPSHTRLWAGTSHKTWSLRNLRASHKTTVQQTFAKLA
jgi:hypothetical protein